MTGFVALKDRRTDPDFPAELSQMVREDRDVAVAVSSGPAFLSGVGKDRQETLRTNALEAFAPDDNAQLLHAVAVGKEADRMQAGMNKLHGVAYTKAVADRTRSTFVDTQAPFATPPADA